MIAKKLTDLIGNTPLLQLSNYNIENSLEATIIAKLEYFNPLGSIKDRVGFALIEDGIECDKINQDTIIIEPTSGNTGIGLAFVAASKGLKLILTMPDTMSEERINVLKALGAEIVLTTGSKGMKGAIDKAKELADKYENSYIPQQFENQANVEIHKKTTAIEILNDMDRNIDIFVAGVGTGGTITGVGTVLKEKNPNIRIVAVEPSASAILSGGVAGAHKIQGIGANFIPKILDLNIIDEIIKVENESAFQASRDVAKSEGLLVGISSGAALYAATQLAKRPENKAKNILVIFPDTGERYLSTELFR